MSFLFNVDWWLFCDYRFIIKLFEFSFNSSCILYTRHAINTFFSFFFFVEKCWRHLQNDCFLAIYLEQKKNVDLTKHWICLLLKIYISSRVYCVFIFSKIQKCVTPHEHDGKIKNRNDIKQQQTQTNCPSVSGAYATVSSNLRYIFFCYVFINWRVYFENGWVWVCIAQAQKLVFTRFLGLLGFKCSFSYVYLFIVYMCFIFASRKLLYTAVVLSRTLQYVDCSHSDRQFVYDRFRLNIN